MMAPPPRTPRRQYGVATEFITPPAQTSLSRELKQVLNERNLLTAKTRKQVCKMLDDSSPASNGSSGISDTGTVRRRRPPPPAHNSEADKRKSFRLQAIEEILTSERSYLDQLELLIGHFVRPLQQQPHLIGHEQFMAIFGQVEMIYNLNLELYTELQADLANVSKAFKRMAPFFKLYSVYAFDYNRAQLILQELTDKNLAFKRFLEQTESHPSVQRKLISLLIAPIQRVPRYRLLLQQVILYSSPCESDFKMLQDSIREVEATVSHLNGVIQDQENTQNMLDLQNSLVNRMPSIVKPSRKVIKEGVLHKMSSTGSKLKRYCVLMSDIFMYCKCLKERTRAQHVVGALQCCCIFPLKKCRVTEVFPGTFKLTCQGDGAIFCADTAQLARSWTAEIKQTVEVHIQCRKTIRKGSSKRTPIRKRRDVKYFESEQIMSPTRKKYDYESVFKFISDSDSDDSEAAVACFNVKPKKIFKRKMPPATNTLSSSQHQQPVAAADHSMYHIQNWFHRHQHAAPPPDHNSSAFDPTYGFAKFNAATTVSSPANSSCSSMTGASPTSGLGGYQDVLYPLRTSGNSRYSNCSSSNSRAGRAELNTTSACGGIVYEAAAVETPRKRVKFDISVAPRKMATGEPFSFQRSCEQQAQLQNFAPVQPLPSLRSRIMHFFSNLF